MCISISACSMRFLLSEWSFLILQKRAIFTEFLGFIVYRCSSGKKKKSLAIFHKIY